jgi:hypothetical protein
VFTKQKLLNLVTKYSSSLQKCFFFILYIDTRIQAFSRKMTTLEPDQIEMFSNDDKTDMILLTYPLHL